MDFTNILCLFIEWNVKNCFVKTNIILKVLKLNKTKYCLNGTVKQWYSTFFGQVSFAVSLERVKVSTKYF